MDFEEWQLKNLPKRFEEFLKRYEGEVDKKFLCKRKN
jgi:hypothetical protein